VQIEAIRDDGLRLGTRSTEVTFQRQIIIWLPVLLSSSMDVVYKICRTGSRWM